MLLTVRLVMLLLGLLVAGLAIAGIVALARRRWARGFWLGFAATGGYVASYAAGALSRHRDRPSPGIRSPARPRC